MDALAKLFGTQARVRLLRLYLFNPHEKYDRDQAARRAKTTRLVAAKEIRLLVAIGILTKMSGVKGSGGYRADIKHPLYEPLRTFLLDTLPLSPDDLIRAIRSAGRIRLVVASGFFVGEWDQRVDLLIVGDKIDDAVLAAAIKRYELEVGRELHYTCLSSEDYQYRVSIQDRLVRDIFDYPHRVFYERAT